MNDNTSIQLASNDEILIYQSEDGTIKVDVLFQDETVWLTIDNMCLLFGKARSTINEHILNVFSEGELEEEKSVRKIGISDFSTKPTNFYNLDVIISVGYRVKSHQGTLFRIWATQRLRDWIEYLKMVLTMNRKSILADAGRISHQMAMEKAESEYNKYKSAQRQIEHIESIKELEADIKRLQGGGGE